MHQAKSSKRNASSKPQTEPEPAPPPQYVRDISFDYALRAAGIDPEAEPPANMDEFRLHLARRITVITGTAEGYWRDCPEPGCRRARVCLAPNIKCRNAPPLPPDPDRKEWDRVRLEVHRALKAHLAKYGAEDD